jgi:hypothetical protein
MTGEATFGDFLQAASLRAASLPAGPAAGPGGTSAKGSDAREVTQSLLRVVTVMARYLKDITAPFDQVLPHNRPALNAWARASIEARQALASAAGVLQVHGAAERQPDTSAHAILARRLDAAAVSLTIGRDLLQTHFAPGARGARRPRSDWALAVTSQPVTRALLAELALLAQQIAPQCTGPALPPSPAGDGTRGARLTLDAACQWLSVFGAAIGAAQLQEPVPDCGRELLRAIPLNALPPRRLPDGTEPVADLCDAVTGSAHRARHAAWEAAAQAAWSPGMTHRSLRGVAEASMITSHHCEVLLRSLAARQPAPGPAEISTGLLKAADAAGRARAGWLQLVHALDGITTDTRRYESRATTEARDLALWTGRLAYASPQWTLSSGPAHEARAPQSLAPEPQDVPRVVGAVHHACETLAQIVRADSQQIGTAARAGRILVPTRSLPDTYDIPVPYHEAPPGRIDALLAVYQHTGEAAARARDAAAEVAETTRAHSRMLAAARTAARASPENAQGKEPDSPSRVGTAEDWRDPPGQMESILRDLDVRRPDLLRRAAAIDRASEQLIAAAVAERSPRRGRLTAQAQRKSAATAELLKYALASGDHHVIEFLREPPQRQPESPEAEP